GMKYQRDAVHRAVPGPASRALPFLGLLIFFVVLAQATLVVQARPQDLITGAHGMADILRRAWPPDFSQLPHELWPALETVDIAFFGTCCAVVMAVPLAVLAARNTSPGRLLYFGARGVIAFARAVPDLVWALLFVTAVESRCGAVAVGRTYPLPPLSSGGALLVRPWLRLHTPLIERGVRISRTTLSDKTSRLRPRHVVPKPRQTDEPE